MTNFRLIFIILVVFYFSNALCETSSKDLFNDNWYFVRDDSESINMSLLINDEIIPTNWEKVTLPHTSKIEPLIVNNQWQGVCYYAKYFNLNNSRMKEYFIKFESAMNVTDVWVNGKKLGTHVGGFLPFVFDITDVVRFDRKNIIVLKLDNRDNPITGPKPLKKLDFNMYGGVYRDVWLIKKESVYITDVNGAKKVAGGGIFITTDSVSLKSALIHVKTHIKNEELLRKSVVVKQIILDNKHKKIITFQVQKTLEPNSTNEIALSAKINNPKLWSPDFPNLYILKTEIYVDNKLVDQEQNHFGVREVVIRPDGLWLNGKKTFLRGVNRHQEYPYIGYALSNNAQWRDAYKIKEAGFDYVRASHYPVSPAFLDACDQYGIFVLEPILGWQFFGDSLFIGHAKESAREMIRRDRNHPCILAWELSINEIKMPQSFMDDMVKIGKEEFPGKNTYVAGWRKESYDIYIEARQHRKEAFLTKPLIVSEYGDWEYYAMNAGFEQDKWSGLLKEERTSRQARGAGEVRLLQQATNIQQAHNDNLSTHAFADGYWVMFDYNRGYVDDLELSGTMDIFRLPKLSYYFFKSQRSYDPRNKFSSPMVYIASYWQPNISKTVRVFSNCDKVELFLDGKSLGIQKPDSNSISNNLNHAPFTFNISCNKLGTLKAIGYINQRKIKSNRVSTSGKPVQIKLSIDRSGINPQKNCNDVVFVYATVYDEKGNQVNDYSKAISFSVIGDAEIISSNISYAEAGIAPILLRIGKKGGLIKIKADGENLKNDHLSFYVK